MKIRLVTTVFYATACLFIMTACTAPAPAPITAKESRANARAEAAIYRKRADRAWKRKDRHTALENYFEVVRILSFERAPDLAPDKAQVQKLRRILLKEDEKPVPKDGITRIDFRHVGNRVSPNYSVTILANNQFLYIGEPPGAKPVGVHTGHIDPWYTQNLIKFIKRINFFEFKDEYENPLSCGRTLYTTVYIGGKQKTIRDYGSYGPGELWALEELIQMIVFEAEWDKRK